MKAYLLDELDLLDTNENKSKWISKISQKDLYSLATWLMNHLNEQSQERQHKRSQIRGVLDWYYQYHYYLGVETPWTDKQKWFIGHSVIDLWAERQIDQDPRYQF
jgi:lysyl-tRNA synthetase class II